MRELPIACTLDAAGGRNRLEQWAALANEYELGRTREPGRLVVDYVRVDDSRARLDELVAGESKCCSFATWSIEMTDQRLRLVVTGTASAIDSLNVA